MGLGSFSNGDNDILFFLILFLLLFDGGKGSCNPCGDDNGILFFLIVFLLLFNGGGVRRPLPC